MTERLAPWLGAPLEDFVRLARVRLALVLETNGRVLAQHGFARSLDVMGACSLAAAIHASASQLGHELGTALGPLHHAGGDRQLFLAPVGSGSGTLLLLAVFDRDSSLGIVRHFFAAFARHLEHAAPREHDHLTGEDLERALGRNLAVLFGRA